MRIPTKAVLTSLMIVLATPAVAQTYGPEYPVCLHQYHWGGGDNFNCTFASLAQCAMSASGLPAECVINPYYARAELRQRPLDRRLRRIH
jgi:hypothetical protein